MGIVCANAGLTPELPFPHTCCYKTHECKHRSDQTIKDVGRKKLTQIFCVRENYFSLPHPHSTCHSASYGRLIYACGSVKMMVGTWNAGADPLFCRHSKRFAKLDEEFTQGSVYDLLVDYFQRSLLLHLNFRHLPSV